jgi:hypothetical protein
MNQTKDPVLFAHFGGEKRAIRWDYNTLAELQPLGYDFTDEEFTKSVVGSKPSLKMLRAFACAALASGAEDGREFTPREVGRTVTADGEKSDLFAKVSELMQLAHGEAEPESPLAEKVVQIA